MLTGSLWKIHLTFTHSSGWNIILEHLAFCWWPLWAFRKRRTKKTTAEKLPRTDKSTWKFIEQTTKIKNKQKAKQTKTEKSTKSKTQVLIFRNYSTKTQMHWGYHLFETVSFTRFWNLRHTKHTNKHTPLTPYGVQNPHWPRPSNFISQSPALPSTLDSFTPVLMSWAGSRDCL